MTETEDLGDFGGLEPFFRIIEQGLSASSTVSTDGSGAHLPLLITKRNLRP